MRRTLAIAAIAAAMLCVGGTLCRSVLGRAQRSRASAGIQTWWNARMEDWDDARAARVNGATLYFGALSDELAAERLRSYFAEKNGRAFDEVVAMDLCIIFHGILRTTPKGGPWRVAGGTVVDRDFPQAAAEYVERCQRIAAREGVAKRIWWQVCDEVRRDPKNPQTNKAADVLLTMVKAIKQRVPEAKILCVCWPTPEIVPYLDAVAYSLAGKPYPGETTRIDSVPVKVGYWSGGFDSYLAGRQAGYMGELRRRLRGAGLRRVLFYKWDAGAAEAWQQQR